MAPKFPPEIHIPKSGNFDIDGDRRLLCQYSAVKDDIEADNFQAGNLDPDDNMGYVQIPSSEDDNPNDSGVGEETKNIEPTVGMKFKDENDVFEFYKHYTYQIGFPVRKRNSKKGDDGVVRYVTLTCSREGRRTSGTTTVLKPQPTMQTGCKVRLTACSKLTGGWRINTVHLEHNHKTSSSKSRLYRCNRQISARVKRQLEINDIAGIPLHKSFYSAVVEAGDAIAIQSYFSKIQATSPGFYFSIDLDDEARLRNIFWADKRCRQACKEFGDVVTFDTTYLTNKYEMPFAPFVGVNHHGQSTLLGCDQDRAMRNAIEIIFPNTKHRWCLWHIMKKLPEKFGGHKHKAPILHVLHCLVYDVHNCEEFEQGSKKMLEDYDLHEHTWLADGPMCDKVRNGEIIPIGLHNRKVQGIPGAVHRKVRLRKDECDFKVLNQIEGRSQCFKGEAMDLLKTDNQLQLRLMSFAYENFQDAIVLAVTGNDQKNVGK
ncbi:protein FAR1-RELATED SEQUENCE 5-like [Olea europaea var. sylvestris]|uniref:protein FAR1-RELATED SEQUENCE 5-like n=1 Tax=Olea europaea var. sylvestris TaxID=158386 RepID=UPI000C1D5F71|nr:protein FAR1-RELATED SEQUENCE 5-like [Olea europaea var. sylvestris]